MNIFEFLGGTNPKNATDTPRAIGEVRNLSAYGLPQNYFTARFTASSLVDDVAFSFEGSAALENWSASSIAFVTNTPLANGLYEYLFRETNVLAAANQGFMRLRAEQTP